jgi:Reverse transcriptase (RNA-dependent DNA polymerase)
MNLDELFIPKENLTPEQLLIGLLDYGLFSEKVPPCFTSIGLSIFAQKYFKNFYEANDEKELKKIIDSNANDYIRYEALRDTNVPRNMGIPHPASYAIQVLGIVRHWNLIQRHCNKPTYPHSRIFVRRSNNQKIFEMSYKGKERYEVEEKELEWMFDAKYLVKVDIAQCFPSIYSHSIPWALHTKSQSKSKSKPLNLVGDFLDKITQCVRDKQTNGLLIGPHASNVISEIILTEIDCQLETTGFTNFHRHIDDYSFYAKDIEQAELFIKKLGLFLRGYEMAINDKKTEILELPRASTEGWVSKLKNFSFPNTENLKISTIRAYLDLALESSKKIGKSTPLNYAIKTLNSKILNDRAKRMYTQEILNLAIAYPYLIPLVDEYIFKKIIIEKQSILVTRFCTKAVQIGINKNYPDAISHALYYALKYSVIIELEEKDLLEIICLDDCLTNVLLLEYANTNNLVIIKKEIVKKGNEIKKSEPRDISKNWLLIYQLWSESELKGKGQNFLAELKKIKMNFLIFKQA